MVINGAIVSDLDMMYIESVLQVSVNCRKLKLKGATKIILLVLV